MSELRNKANTVSYRAASSSAQGQTMAVAVASPAALGGEPSLAARAMFPILGWNLPLPSSLRALGHRNFRLYWIGQLISLVGTWMQAIARGWLVLELTHSAFWLGMVGFANSVPVLVLSPWAGEIADKVSKRTLIIWTQTLSMFAAFVLAALTLTGTVEVWHVFVISLFVGAVFAFDAPS